MKDFEQLTDEEQQDVIMKIGSKLDKQEMWYWMGLVHLLREQDRRIKKAREYIEETDNFDVEIFDESTGGCLGTDLSREAKHLLEILEGKDV